MDRKEFINQLRRIDAVLQQRGVPPVPLSDDEVKEVDDRVLQHIHNLYPIDELEKTEQPGMFGTVKKYIPPANDDRYGFPSWAAVAAIAGVVVVGTLLFVGQPSNNNQGFPGSVAQAELHQQVHLPVGGPAAITSPKLTERRNAYLAGYANANLYAIGDTDPVKAQNFAIWYLAAARNPIEKENALVSFQRLVDGYLDDETTNFWYQQGLATELVQLAAKGAMDDMDTGVLQEAMRYYGQSSEAISEHIKAVDQRYFDRHIELLNLDTPSTSGELQQIINATQALKVLIR